MIAIAEPRGLASDAAGLARALEAVPIAVALFDRHLRLVRANDRFRALTGCPGGSPSALDLTAVFPTALAAVGPVLTAAALRHAQPPRLVAFADAGGACTTAEVSVVRLPDALEREGCREDGLLFVASEPAGTDGAAATPGASLQPAAAASAASATTATAATRALVHDLSNLLGHVGNAAHLIALRADDPAAVRAYAARIAAAVERGAALLGHTPPAAAGTGGAVTPAGRVLVVEDDDDGRDFMAALVQSAGRPVVAVPGVAAARAALEDATASGTPFSLLVTDVRLDDGCGWTLAAEARRRWPALRVGVVTGWDAVEDRDVGAHFVLHKPIRIDDLLAQVASAS